MGPGNKPTDRETAPTVGVVVINLNGGNWVLNTLSALELQEYRLEEVIVVDNGSTDGSPAEIKQRFPWVTVLELEKNEGLPAARNLGLASLESDLALILDYDVYVELDCLSHLVRALREERAVLACPQVRLFNQPDVVQAAGASVHFLGTMILRHGYVPLQSAPAQRESVDGCIGACMLVEREVVLAAGGFDSLYFFILEDLEFGLRLRSFGHRLVCEPKAVVHHDRGDATPRVSYRGTGSYPSERAYLTMRNRLNTILIHYRARTLVLLSPALAVYEFSVAIVALSRGWLSDWIRALAWLLKNRTAIRERRGFVQSQRILNDREILMGGEIPLAPGFLQSPLARAGAAALSTTLDLYWRLARRWIG